ncbi:hypothetical protein LSH36_430g01000 [Paralvinella palmiformis]|uniref:Uncharacterized protein n=1 Tax=Paralvinella palmiformis TaxID=53620 RepID=A0AAD9MZJ2_9ANNE|nr:hypothetical protein LSH36_430g01000 [Paralvinella palmiformis]
MLCSKIDHICLYSYNYLFLKYFESFIAEYQ